MQFWWVCSVTTTQKYYGLSYWSYMCINYRYYAVWGQLFTMSFAYHEVHLIIYIYQKEKPPWYNWNIVESGIIYTIISNPRKIIHRKRCLILELRTIYADESLLSVTCCWTHSNTLWSLSGQFKQLHSFWSCLVTDPALRNCYSNIHVQCTV